MYKILRFVFVLVAIAGATASAFAQVDEQRDTLFVHNALLTDLSISERGDTFLIISGDTVYYRIGLGSAFNQDTFYIKQTCGGIEGWVFSGDTIYIDTCGSSPFIPLWQLSGTTVLPTNATYGVGIGNTSNKLLYDGSTGLNIYGYPNQIYFYVRNATFAKFFNNGSSRYIIPATDNSTDLGQSSVEWKNGYFDGTLRTDVLTVDENATVADSLTIGGTTPTAPLTITSAISGLDYTKVFSIGGVSEYANFSVIEDDPIPGDNLWLFVDNGGLAIIPYTYFGDAVIIQDTCVIGDLTLIGNLTPSSSNTSNIGSSLLKLKNGYFDGTLNTDILTVDEYGTVTDSLTIGQKLIVGGATNYTTIDTNGLILHGNHTVWDDLRVNPTSEGIPANRAPDWTAYKSSYVQAFDNAATPALEDEVFFRIQIPHAWKAGSTIYPHIHWTTPTAAASDSVSWEFYYSWANEGAAFPDADSLMVTTLVGASADIHHTSYFAGISGTGKTESSMLLCGMKRHSTEAGDTYNGEVYLLEVDIHIEIEKLGTIQKE